MTTSNSSPAPLSANSNAGQGPPKSPLAALAFLSFTLERCGHLRLNGIAQAWHDFLFVLLVGSLSVDLFLELMRSTTAGLHGARQKVEPVWPAIADMWRALGGLLRVLLPPLPFSLARRQAKTLSTEQQELN